MDVINGFFTKVFDVLLGPLAASPLAAPIVVSGVAGVIMSFVFRWTSNQEALRRTAGRTRAMVLSLRLFRDDLRVALRCQWELIVAIISRLWYSLPPMLVLALPFYIVIVQLAARYEHRPLAVGEAVVVEISVAPEAWTQWRDAELNPPEGVVVETPGVRDAAGRLVSWRLRAEDVTHGSLHAAVDGIEIAKTIVVAEDTWRLCIASRSRPGPGLVERTMYPTETALPADSPVSRIDVRLPRRATPVLGIDTPWWLTFIVVSMIAALIAGKVVGVQY